jgi:hypothetical protein
MFRVEFYLDFFGSSLASMSQSFRIAGAGRVRVKQDPESFVGQLDRRDYFVARSSKPFVVVITTKAEGGDAHLDGQTLVLVATDQDGYTGATVHAAGSDYNKYRRFQQVVEAPAESAAA